MEIRMGLCLLASSTSLALAGGMTSSGGEFLTTERNPWYVGSREVTYCVRSSVDFSVPLDSARRILADVIADWTWSLNEIGPQATPFVLPDGEAKNLTLKFSEVGCDQRPELSFAFGSFSPQVEEILQQMARHTAAFAGHEGIDDRSGRAKNGIVWLVPDRGARRYQGPTLGEDFWSREHVLHNVLMHEMGHVFGFLHGEDGIMDEGFPAQALRSKIPRTSAKRFAYHNWLSRKLQICARGLDLEQNFVRRVLRSNYVILWDICFASRESEQSPLSAFRVSFVSERSVVRRDFRVEIRQGSVHSHRVREVRAKYFAQEIGGPGDYRTHEFLRLEDSRYSGYLVNDSGARFPFVFDKTNGRVRMDIVGDNELYDFDFGVDDLVPIDQTANRSKFK